MAIYSSYVLKISAVQAAVLVACIFRTDVFEFQKQRRKGIAKAFRGSAFVFCQMTERDDTIIEISSCRSKMQKYQVGI